MHLFSSLRAVIVLGGLGIKSFSFGRSHCCSNKMDKGVNARFGALQTSGASSALLLPDQLFVAEKGIFSQIR